MKKFLRKGSEGKVYQYNPFGVSYELEGEDVMNCQVYEYKGGQGYGRYCGQIPMTLSSIKNQDGLHV